MANHLVQIAAESTVDQATVTTALNAALAAKITAVGPQPLHVYGYSATASIAVGPLKLYLSSVLVQYEG